jgi:hypothetical protein
MPPVGRRTSKKLSALADKVFTTSRIRYSGSRQRALKLSSPPFRFTYRRRSQPSLYVSTRSAHNSRQRSSAAAKQRIRGRSSVITPDQAEPVSCHDGALVPVWILSHPVQRIDIGLKILHSF